MKKAALSMAAAILFVLVAASPLLAQNKVQDHNSSRSNKSAGISIPGNGWNFGAGTGASFSLKTNESSLFRGNSMATKVFAHYNFGTMGLGINTGIVPGTISSISISGFITERKFPTDAIINSSKPLNAYLLLGPSVNFGRQVTVSTGVSGGIFYNNAGGLTISQQGVTRALYRFDAGSKNVFPGFSGTVNIGYPLNKSTRFFINSDYLQTTSSIRLLDPQRGIDVAAEQNRTVKLFTAGVGIIKSFSTAKDEASGPAKGKKHIGNVKYEDIAGAKEAESGQAPSQRILSPRDPASGMPTGKRMAATTGSQSCGPVTVKRTSPDGSVEEQEFSCPADAAAYAKQTQGTSFGEKVNQGLHAAGSALSQGASLKNGNIINRDVAARNIIAGMVSWSSGASGGIVTNQSAAVSSISGSGGGAASASYAATGRMMSNGPNGISTAIHTRDAASGLATGKRGRDAASGQATGRSQYQPVFFEGENNNCTDCNVKVQSNPLYKDNGMNGTNPLHKSNSFSGNDCNGVSGLNVYLVDLSTGATVASTVTEECGTFYFANVPSGDYGVKISGRFTAKKGYDMYLAGKNSYDVAGEILSAADSWTVEILTAEGTPEDAAALIKTKTKSNQSNDRIINTSRSNIKNLAVSLADTDGDGLSEIWVGSVLPDAEQEGVSLLGGSLPGGAVISAFMRPGNPIGGLNIKGGKNPGGNLRTSSTNNYGEFEFTGWEPGNYTITAEMHYVIADETLISTGVEFTSGNNTSGTSIKDIPAVAGKSDNAKSVNSINGGMPNRISMNVTVPKQTQGSTFGEKVNAGLSAPGMRAQNNNTVRSNRTDNALIIADMDGDGEMESSVLNFNGEVATITLSETVTAGKVMEKATSGLKDVIKTQVRMAAGGPKKWIAKDKSLTRVHGDPHVDEKDGRLVFEGSNTSVLKNSWRNTPVAVKAMRCSDGTCAVITGSPDDYPADTRLSLNGLPPCEPVTGAVIWFTDNKGTIYSGETDADGRISLNGLPPGQAYRMLMNLSCAGTDDIFITFSNDAQGNAISNVLKTKHDTAKNAIGNIR